jgi:tRNA(Ile)-lysidine synthase TilS/MesJ
MRCLLNLANEMNGISQFLPLSYQPAYRRAFFRHDLRSGTPEHNCIAGICRRNLAGAFLPLELRCFVRLLHYITGHHVSMIESILRNARLVQIDNIWVLLYKDREYVRLLDAKSRADAEQQIAELLLLLDTDQQSSSRDEGDRTYPLSGSSETHQ